MIDAFDSKAITSAMATLLTEMAALRREVQRLAAIVEAGQVQPMTRQQALQRATELLAKQVESGAVNVAEIARATGIPAPTLKTHKEFRRYLSAARDTLQAAKEISEQTLQERGAAYDADWR